MLLLNSLQEMLKNVIVFPHQRDSTVLMPKGWSCNATLLLSTLDEGLDPPSQLNARCNGTRWRHEVAFVPQFPFEFSKQCNDDDDVRCGRFLGTIPPLPSCMCFLNADSSIINTSGPLNEAQTAVAIAAPTLNNSLAMSRSCSSASSFINSNSFTITLVPSGCCR